MNVNINVDDNQFYITVVLYDDSKLFTTNDVAYPYRITTFAYNSLTLNRQKYFSGTHTIQLRSSKTHVKSMSPARLMTANLLDLTFDRHLSFDTAHRSRSSLFTQSYQSTPPHEKSQLLWHGEVCRTRTSHLLSGLRELNTIRRIKTKHYEARDSTDTHDRMMTLSISHDSVITLLEKLH